jgi:hypothetical protein
VVRNNEALLTTERGLASFTARPPPQLRSTHLKTAVRQDDDTSGAKSQPSQLLPHFLRLWRFHLLEQLCRPLQVRPRLLHIA